MKTTLYIVNHSYKNEMLKQTTAIKNNKYMTMKELKHFYIFDYGEEAIYYLMKTKNIKYMLAKNYIEAMYDLWNAEQISDPKIENLQMMYKELESHNLIVKNSLCKEFLRETGVVVKEIYLNKYEHKILNDIKKYTSVTIEPSIKQSYVPKVYVANTIEEEVAFVASQIIEKLKETDISHIKVSFTEEYEYIICLIFKQFHLPFCFSKEAVLYGNSVCKEWINTLEQTKNILTTYQQMLEKHGMIESIIALIDITNTLPEEEVTDTYLAYFITKCKMKKIHKKRVEGIKRISLLEEYISDDDYIYLLGCNRENMPRIYKDEEYLSDEIKKLLEVDTSFDKNRLENSIWREKIKSIKNLTITYKKKTAASNYAPSSLLESYTVKPVENRLYNFSHLYNKLSLARKLDNVIKYNIKDEDIDCLYHTYKTIPYRTYQNIFTGIDQEDIQSHFHQRVQLSYSSINNYYLCSFRYYIANVLKLDIFEENFTTEVGNLYHYVLSKSIDPNFDFDLIYNSYIEKREWNYKEQFFLKKLKEELHFVIDTLSYQNRFTTLKKALCEEKMYTHPTQNITFLGIVDKIMYKEEEGKKTIAIVDYKTGTPQVELMNIPYGLEMQLPIYVYLLKHNPQFKEAKIVGFYLQKILNKNFSYDGEDYTKEKRKLLRLDGYSIDDETLLEQFDTTYKDSEVIKGMKTGRNGFYRYTKILSASQMNLLSKCVEKKIIEAGNSILQGNFPINPKRIEGELIGCKYCKFKDICFKTEKDIVTLQKNHTLDFLGGE